MRFLSNLPAFKFAADADANYDHGHIYAIDDAPAVFVCKTKIDLGLAACRDRLIQDTLNNQGRYATVYGRTDNEYNPVARSTFSTSTRDQTVRAAYNALDISLRDQVLPYVKCRGFDFHDMIMARGNQNVFQVHQRQHLVYQADDHFDNPHLVNGTRGHADDSLFQNRWVRNDPQRIFVGLLYLSTRNEECAIDSRTEFAGGELRFPMVTNSDDDTPFAYSPKFGELVFFPASPLYIHAVPKITKGTRIVVTTWYSIPGYN
jgi:hypothetical protein